MIIIMSLAHLLALNRNILFDSKLLLTCSNYPAATLLFCSGLQIISPKTLDLRNQLQPTSILAHLTDPTYHTNASLVFGLVLGSIKRANFEG